MYYVYFHVFNCVSFSFVNHAMKWYMFSWTEAHFGLPYLYDFCFFFFEKFINRHNADTS